MIPPLGGLVDRTLADQDARGEKHRLERENRRQQWERKLIEMPALRGSERIGADPNCYRETLKNEEIDGANEPADRVEYAVMRLKLPFVLFLDPEDQFDIACRCTPNIAGSGCGELAQLPDRPVSGLPRCLAGLPSCFLGCRPRLALCPEILQFIIREMLDADQGVARRANPDQLV